MFWVALKKSYGLSTYNLGLVSKELPFVLKGLEQEPKGSWLHGLSDMVPELVELVGSTFQVSECTGDSPGVWPRP